LFAFGEQSNFHYGVYLRLKIKNLKALALDEDMGNTFISLIDADPLTFVRGAATKILVIED